MRLRAQVIDKTGFDGRLRRLPKEAEREVGKAVNEAALTVQGEARKSIQRGARTGRVYQKYAPKRRHQASGPGEPPKTDTGRLVASIFAELDPDGLGAKVGTDLPYGTYLEFGTEDMEARPWLHPTFERLKKRIVKKIDASVRKAIKQSGRK